MKKGVKEIKQTSKVLGIFALIFGILAFILALVPFLGLLLSITAIILSGIGLGKLKEGRGFAIAGLVLGILAFLISLTPTLIFSGVIWFAGHQGNVTTNASIQTARIGEKVVVDDIAYTVTGISFTDKMNYAGTGTATPQTVEALEALGVFLVVNLKIENVGKETTSLFISRFNIIDNESRKFSSDSKADYYLKDPLTMGQQLQPGLPIVREKVFDIPKTAKGLKLQIGSHKAFSSKIADVDLGK